MSNESETLTALDVVKPGHPTLHIGPFRSDTTCAEWKRRLETEMVSTAHPEDTTIERVPYNALTNPTYTINPEGLSRDPYEIAREMRQEPDGDGTGSNFPDLWTRMYSQFGLADATVLWDQAGRIVDEDAAYEQYRQDNIAAANAVAEHMDTAERALMGARAQLNNTVQRSAGVDEDLCPLDADDALIEIDRAALSVRHISRIMAGFQATIAKASVRTYTHSEVFSKGVQEGWADPETDPARIDWVARRANAAIPFALVDGRPLNPFAPTGIRYGRNQLGHWGEQICADAVVTTTDEHGHRWLVMVGRKDGYGCALPGGTVDPGEDPADAAVRELAEETGLDLGEVRWEALPARYVPDPRASDEAWMVTVPSRVHLGTVRRADLPTVVGADDAKWAAWVRADSYPGLVAYLKTTHQGRVFAAHQDMLADLLG